MWQTRGDARFDAVGKLLIQRRGSSEAGCGSHLGQELKGTGGVEERERRTASRARRNLPLSWLQGCFEIKLGTRACFCFSIDSNCIALGDSPASLTKLLLIVLRSDPVPPPVHQPIEPAIA